MKPAITNSSAQLTAESMIARHGLEKAEQVAERFAVQAKQKQAREFWLGVAAEIVVHKTQKTESGITRRKSPRVLGGKAAAKVVNTPISSSVNPSTEPPCVE